MGEVAKLSEPDFFMSSYIWSFGNTDLSDFQLIYMNNEEASLYFLAEAIWLPWAYPFALVWSMFFWEVYALVFAGAIITSILL